MSSKTSYARSVERPRHADNFTPRPRRRTRVGSRRPSTPSVGLATLGIVATFRTLILLGVSCLAPACTRDAPADPAPVAQAPASPPTNQPASQPASQPSSAPKRTEKALPPSAVAVPLGKHYADIRYVDSVCPGTAACDCDASALFHGRNALLRLGWEEAQLSELPCLLADFDGNGFTDAAFVGPEPRPSPTEVLMFDDVGLSATVRLPRPVSELRLAEGAPGKALLASKELLFIYSGERFQAAVPAAKTHP